MDGPCRERDNGPDDQQHVAGVPGRQIVCGRDVQEQVACHECHRKGHQAPAQHRERRNAEIDESGHSVDERRLATQGIEQGKDDRECGRGPPLITEKDAEQEQEEEEEERAPNRVRRSHQDHADRASHSHEHVGRSRIRHCILAGPESRRS